MIQRVQSVYLIISAIITLLIFYFPIADLTTATETYSFWYRGLYGILLDKEVLIEHSTPLAILYLLTLMLIISTIFLYKLRPVQMKLCFINIILTIICVGLTLVYLFIVYSDFKANVQFKLFALLPFVSVFFLYMAYRGIKKDEELVKSVDRIR